ncbi:MAG: hypothetical protein RXR20_33150 [Paraburkholderia sp.]|uniref:hypothetical protein n=1 Tax=Paraburkholderia sp. TaxID=1926495 RepID=UPI00397D7E89
MQAGSDGYLFPAHNHWLTDGFDLARQRASCVCFYKGEILILNHNEECAINQARDGEASRGSSGISTASPPDTQQDTIRDFAAEWILSAMQTSKQMHLSENFRREVARRLF